jgi:hypothetical protein
MTKRTNKLADEDELSHELDEALANIEQLHYSLPPLDQPTKKHDREHLNQLGEAVREYYQLLKKAKLLTTLSRGGQIDGWLQESNATGVDRQFCAKRFLFETLEIDQLSRPSTILTSNAALSDRLPLLKR